MPFLRGVRHGRRQKKVTQQEIRVWIPDQGIFLLGTEINADVPLERAEVLAEFLYLSIRS